MAKYISIRSGASALPENSVANIAIDLVRKAGIVDKQGGDFLVSESNPQGMSVAVDAGRAFLRKTENMTYHGYSDAEESVAIGANSSGNTRVDAIVLYVDLGATPDATASNVLKLTAVAGTPASSPVAPTDSEIATAIGASNPFLRLADVTVADGASAIADANITDRRVRFRVNNLDELQTLTYATNLELDGDDSTLFEVTATGNITFSVANFKVGEFIYLRIERNTATLPVYTFWSGIKWGDGSIPTVSENGEADAFVFFKRSASAYDGYIVSQGIS